MLYLTVRYPSGKTDYQTLKEEENVIGRNDEAQLKLDEDSVSGYHARIFFENEMFFCEDGFRGHSSRNGTWVNGKRVDEAVPLEKGDTILIGSCHLMVTGIGKSGTITQEIPFLKDKQNLTAEDMHRLQLQHLERKIRFQSLKIWGSTLFLVALMLSALFFVWRKISAEEVHVIKVPSRTQKAEKVLLTARAEAQSSIAIETPITGIIAHIYKKPGEMVEAGDLLVLIKGITDYNITSETTGRLEPLSKLKWKIDATVEEGEILGSIVDTNKIKLFFDIPEKQLQYWAEKNEIDKIYFDNISDIYFKGKLEKLLFEGIIVVDIDNGKAVIEPGMIGHITYQPKDDGGFLLPAQCLVPDLDFPAVFQINNDKCYLKKITIKKQFESKKKILVAEGIKKGDLLILSPNRELRNGQLIKIVKR